MAMARVRVRRDRPGAAAWAVALAATMLAVYLLTLPVREKSDSLFVSAPVTREMALGRLELWCVSLGRCGTAEEARILASGLSERGAAGVAADLDGAWQALGAAYGTQADAQRVAARLRDEAGLDAAALRVGAEPATLRVTAPEAQLDDVSAADALLREQIAALGTLASQLDKGEASAEAARTLCAVAASQARERARLLRRWPQADSDALCAPLAAQLEALSGHLDAAVNAGSRPIAALSGLLRAAQLEAFIGLVEWQSGYG